MLSIEEEDVDADGRDAIVFIEPADEDEEGTDDAPGGSDRFVGGGETVNCMLSAEIDFMTVGGRRG